VSWQLPHGFARLELSDGTILLMDVMVIELKEAGFSPFGGVKFDVKAIADVIIDSLPEELKERVRDKPIYHPWQELPADGWELIDIRAQEPAVIETTVNTSKGLFSVRVVTEATMVARNLSYRDFKGQPIYYVFWVYKASWKPAGKVTLTAPAVGHVHR